MTPADPQHEQRDHGRLAGHSYRSWLPASGGGSRRTQVKASIRRATVRLLTRMTGMALLRPLGEAGMRLLFDRLAADWEQIRADPLYREALVAGLAELPRQFAELRTPPASVLDVACGTGIGTDVLAQQFPRARVVGADISPAMVEQARQLVPQAEFVACSALQLPFADGEFDLLTSLDGVFVVAELARVTAPGGAIVLVYSKGGECPVARPLHQLQAECEAAGLSCVVHKAAAWTLWAFKPAH